MRELDSDDWETRDEERRKDAGGVTQDKTSRTPVDQMRGDRIITAATDCLACVPRLSRASARVGTRIHRCSSTTEAESLAGTAITVESL